MVAMAPSRAANSCLAAVLAVASTRAPQCAAIWIAAMPTPLAPACTSTHSSGCTLAVATRPYHAVRKTTGIGRGHVVVEIVGNRHGAASRR